MTDQDPTCADLITRKFANLDTGGGCRALYRFDPESNLCVVVTDDSGSGLPTADDWMVGFYKGDWSEDADVPLTDTTDHEHSPMDLLALIDFTFSTADRVSR